MDFRVRLISAQENPSPKKQQGEGRDISPDSLFGSPTSWLGGGPGVPTVKVLYYIEIFILIKKAPAELGLSVIEMSS